MVKITRIPGGYEVDGLVLRRGKCGCGGGGLDCCFTYSRVKQQGDTVIYEGKATAPSTKNNFAWGYRVHKDNIVVEVNMEDTRDNKDFFAGSLPPPLEAWVARGWQVDAHYERPLASEAKGEE